MPQTSLATNGVTLNSRNGVITTQSVDATDISLSANSNIVTNNLNATNDITVRSNNASITTQGTDIDASQITFSAAQGIFASNLTAPNGVTLESGTNVNANNIVTRNAADGGNVVINAGTTITTQQIDTTSTAGTGGNVVLNAPSTIQVDSIRAEGDAAGGNVAITTEEFFRAANSFTSLNGTLASISTEANNGTGSIAISHAGNSITPLPWVTVVFWVPRGPSPVDPFSFSPLALSSVATTLGTLP